MSQIRSRVRQLGDLLQKKTPAELRDSLALVAEISGELEIPAYLVGGAVRDLLLTGELRDLDLVVEGSAAEFARALGERLDAGVRLHPQFLTAELEHPDSVRIDIASSRAESYPEPASLPIVRPGILKEDLERRDFTVNTLAIRLAPEAALELIDSGGGLADLEASVLRVLHPRSFVDDPTRAFRAVRLESRLGMRLEPESERLLMEALEDGFFERLSSSRLRKEVAQLSEEIGTLEASLRRMEELGLLRVLHPRLSFGEQQARRLGRVVERVAWMREKEIALPSLELWRLMLLAIAWDLEKGERGELAERLGLAGGERELLVVSRDRLAGVGKELAGARVAPHRVARALARLQTEEQILLAALAEDEVQRWVEKWLQELRHIELSIGGRELVARGATPGPAIGEALAGTLDARIDGVIDAEDELSYAVELLQKGTRK